MVDTRRGLAMVPAPNHVEEACNIEAARVLTQGQHTAVVTAMLSGQEQKQDHVINKHVQVSTILGSIKSEMEIGHIARANGILKMNREV